MLKKLYVVFGAGVIITYLAFAWLGWELVASGQRTVFGRVPFFSGYRGGK